MNPKIGFFLGFFLFPLLVLGQSMDAWLLKYTLEKNKTERAKIGRTIAETYYQKGFYHKAIEYYEASFLLDSLRLPTETVLHWAQAYRQTEQNGKNLALLEQHFTKGESTQSMQILENLVPACVENREHTKAYFYAQLLMTYAETEKNMDKKLLAYTNLVYLERVLAKKIPKYLNTAVNFVQSNPSKDREGVYNLLINIATNYTQQKDYPNAEVYYKKAIELAESMENSNPKKRMSYLATGYSFLASLYHVKGKKLMAIETFEKSIQTAKVVQNKSVLMTNYRLLSQLYEQNEEFKLAQEYLELYQKINAEVVTEKQAKERELLLQENEAQKKESQIKFMIWEQEKNSAQLQQTILEKEKQKQEIVLLQQQQNIQEAELRNQALEKQRFQQLLEMTKEKAHSERQKQEIAFLQQQQEFQKLALSQKTVEEQKRQQEIVLLSKEKTLRDRELAEEKLKQQINFGIITFFAVLLLLVLIAFLNVRRSREILKKKNMIIQRQSSEIGVKNKELEETLQNLKDAQSQLVQAEKMAGIGTLTAGIAHEINNPINFVKNNIVNVEANLEDILDVVKEYDTITLENAKEKLEEIQKLKEKRDFALAIQEMDVLVRGIKEGANRTAEIVKGLRTFTRLDDEAMKPVDLHENLNATLMLLQNQYKERIEVVKNYGKIPQVSCHIGKINQIFMNLLVNAGQAIEGKGTITITTELKKKEENSFVEIRVRDTGGGIPEHVRHKIFEPFFTTKDVGKGTGLGLSISLGIAKNHGGNLVFETETGKGTEFVLTLPVV